MVPSEGRKNRREEEGIKNKVVGKEIGKGQKRERSMGDGAAGKRRGMKVDEFPPPPLCCCAML